LEHKELIAIINKLVDELDFISARKLIEENMEWVNQYRVHLNSNAREILAFLKHKLDSCEKPLTKSDIATINAINMYASKFDLRGLKLTIKGKEQLLLRKETLNFLNTDAKTLLESMGTIKKESQE